MRKLIKSISHNVGYHQKNTCLFLKNRKKMFYNVNSSEPATQISVVLHNYAISFFVNKFYRKPAMHTFLILIIPFEWVLIAVLFHTDYCTHNTWLNLYFEEIFFGRIAHVITLINIKNIMGNILFQVMLKV